MAVDHWPLVMIVSRSKDATLTLLITDTAEKSNYRMRYDFSDEDDYEYERTCGSYGGDSGVYHTGDARYKDYRSIIDAVIDRWWPQILDLLPVG